MVPVYRYASICSVYVNSTPYVILSAAETTDNFTPFENYPCQVFTLLLDYQLYNCSKTGYEAL